MSPDPASADAQDAVLWTPDRGGAGLTLPDLGTTSDVERIADAVVARERRYVLGRSASAQAAAVLAHRRRGSQRQPSAAQAKARRASRKAARASRKANRSR